MQLSYKAAYGILTVQTLAGKDQPLTTMEIAERLDITRAYAIQITYALKNAGIITPLKGPGGGYTLAAPIEEVSLGAIIRACETDICAPVEGEPQALRKVRRGLQKVISEALDARTVHDL